MISGRTVNLNALSLKHVIPSSGTQMLALASLGDDVFVARFGSQKVEVYDADTLSLQRSIKVPGLGQHPFGLMPCVHSIVYMSLTGTTSAYTEQN